MTKKQSRRSVALQIDDEILGPAIDRIIAFRKKRYNDDPIACDGLEAETMRLIRAAMAEAIVALDDLILTEDPRDDRSHGALVLQPSRAATWSVTRFGLRKVYGAKPGEYDFLRKAGPIANAHFIEQAEARHGGEFAVPFTPLHTGSREA